jgi:hypothetical protein
MLVVGAGSPHLDDMIYMNGRLDPGNSNFLKVRKTAFGIEISTCSARLKISGIT